MVSLAFVPGARRTAPLALAAPLVLAACGAPQQDVFAPPCPQPMILGDAGDLVRSRDNSRDPTDLQLQARIAGLSGTCQPGGRDHTKVTVRVAMEVARGPAAPSRQAEFAWFLAVMRNNEILDKRDFPLGVEFPPNNVRLELTPEPVVLSLPTPKGTTAADYQVVAGLQLTPDELARNRAEATPR